MKIRSKAVWGCCVVLALLGNPARSLAQTTTPPPPQDPATPPATPADPQASDPDVRLDPLQPDFSLASLPTTLRLPAHKMAFEVTHRFTRSLGTGDLGDLFSNFFGFDSGAQIGLEFRYGLRPGTQVMLRRTSNREIEILGQQSVLQEKADGHPLSLDVIATFEGGNNLHDRKSPAVGVLLSKKLEKVAAVYVEPIFITNTNPFETGDKNTMMIGLGGRVRIRPTVYIVGEMSPRVSGYKPGVDQGSFGIEMRAGGHTFQINFSNGTATTLGELALGGVSSRSWFIGFNIGRKFF